MNVIPKENALPLISVIIPAYNAAETLEKACESVLTQDYGNVELVVVNDGSKDNTAMLLENLCQKWPGLRAVNQANGGVCRARNAGLECARGEYVAFLDADDEMLPGSLTMLFGLLQQHGCDIAAGNFLRQYPGKEEAPRAYRYGAPLFCWKDTQALENTLKDHPATYTVWGKLYRREAIGQTRFVEGRKIHEDSFFIFELYRKQPGVMVTEEPVTRHYMTPHSASRTAFSDKFLDMLYFAQCKCDIIEKEFPQYRDLGRNVLIKASLALLNVLCSAKDGSYKATEQQCLQIVHSNAKYFIPAIPRDVRLFRIVRLRLYWLYKLVYRIYRKIR